MKTVIVCNGSINDYEYHKRFFLGADLVIAADGGANHLEKMNIKPDILLGDFDSFSSSNLANYKEQGIEVIQFPAEKDMTDSELAINIAIERGCNQIVLLGATGSRLDHTMANIFMLKMMLDKGIEGWIANENNQITLIKDRLDIKKKDDINITLLALTQVTGVTIEGFYYPLDDVTLEVGSTWGVSNKLIADKGVVTIKSGLLYVMLTKD